MRSLNRRAALIYGGTSGIGRAIAVALSQHGVQVAITGRDHWRIDKTVLVLQSIAPEVEAVGIVADVRSESDHQNAVHQVLQRFGALDIVVFAAGVASAPDSRALPYDLAATACKDWEDIVRTNLTGAFLAVREAARILKQRRSGDIVLISSARAGRYGSAYTSGYCASKFGLNGLAWSCREELRHFGVRVQLIFPDLVLTPMLVRNGVQQVQGKALPPERIADFALKLIFAPANEVYHNCLIGATGGQHVLCSRWAAPLSTAIL